MEELTYDELRKIQRKEKSPVLSKIPQNFYELANKMIVGYRKDAISDIREYENALKILRDVHARRTEKILIAAFNSTKGVDAPLDSMLVDERQMFENSVKLIKANEDEFIGSLTKKGGSKPQVKTDVSPEVSKEEAKLASELKGSETSEISLIKDVEEFVGMNGETYGPYRNGEKISLPTEEAETLIDIKAAKRM